MKRVIIISILIFYATVHVNAQNSGSSSAPVNINLVRGLTIHASGLNVLDFGEVILNNSSQEVSIPNSEGQQFYITGHPNREITVNYNSEVVLELIDGSENPENGNLNLTFISNIAEQTGSNSSYADPEPLESGGTVTLPKFESAGVLYLWLGGDIHIPENQSSGEYVGQLNIYITY